MKSTGLISADVIERRIFLIRGHKVMLGPYLASLYGIETRVLMQAVRRNIDRFPDDFMFALTREEIEGISQIVTSLKFSKAVYAFTEQGVAMLSSVLRSPSSIQMNSAIMRAFVQLREVLSTHKEFALEGSHGPANPEESARMVCRSLFIFLFLRIRADSRRFPAHGERDAVSLPEQE